MTPQMARGSQVAFANSWLERQNIESQTVDVHSHIDGSLSYEENIKKMKRMLGMGGRSTQQATRTMTAGECDVAIGNYEAGYNGTTMKDACECGHPDACDDLERKKAKAAAKPKKTPTPKAKPKASFTVPGRPSIGKQTIPTKKEFYQIEYWHDPKAGRHPASGAGRLPMRYTAYLESAVVGGDTMWKMHNPATGEDTYFDFADKEEAKKQFKNLYKKTFGTQKATAKPKPKKATKTMKQQKERKRVHIIENPFGTGYVLKYAYRENAYVGGGGMMGGISTFKSAYLAGKEARRSGFVIIPKVVKPPEEGTEVILAGGGAMLGAILGAGHTTRRLKATTTPRLPPLTPPPPAPKRKPPAAKPAKAPKPKPKPKVAAPKRKAAKPKKTAAKPAKPKPQKAAPAGIALTATQKKRLAATGRVTVKRNGKFITITK